MADAPTRKDAGDELIDSVDAHAFRGQVVTQVTMDAFFNFTAPPEIEPLSLHDALPIWRRCSTRSTCGRRYTWPGARWAPDRKSTRLNSSHVKTSYAVFCLKQTNSLTASHLPD